MNEKVDSGLEVVGYVDPSDLARQISVFHVQREKGLCVYEPLTLLSDAERAVQLEMERHRKTWRQLEQVNNAMRRIIERCEVLIDDEAEMSTASVEVLMGIAEDALSQQAEPTPAPQGAVDGWAKDKPTREGAYWIRGNDLDQPALIQVKMGPEDLECNLHIRTTETDFGYGYTIAQLSDDFEWLGPLHLAEQAEPAPAQDEREAFEQHHKFRGMDFTRAETHPEYYASPYANGALDGWMEGRATHPVQTEQQPIRLPPRKSLDGLRDPESKRAGMAYNEALEDVELLNAAPVAQTELVEALRIRDTVLMWSRRHESPPIKEGYEYGVVYAVLSALVKPAKESGHE